MGFETSGEPRLETLSEVSHEVATIPKTKLCMLLFLASEAVFFLMLILAYVYFRGFVSSGPTAASSLDPKVTGIYTIFLLSSSGTVFLAGRSLKQRNRARFLSWLAVTVLFGAIFLVGQGREYAKLLANNVTINRNLFGTTFFTLTGLHGFHVFIGLLLMITLFGVIKAGGEKQMIALESVSLYWHFVDVVWIVIFSIIYLWSAS